MMEKIGLNLILSVCSLILLALSTTVNARRPDKKRQCGTMDLRSSLTKHCFPEDGLSHSVCCVDIRLPGSQRYFTHLEHDIYLSSKSSSYSWCTCSVDICHELAGRVAWIYQPSEAGRASEGGRQSKYVKYNMEAVKEQRRDVSRNSFEALQDQADSYAPVERGGRGDTSNSSSWIELMTDSPAVGGTAREDKATRGEGTRGIMVMPRLVFDMTLTRLSSLSSLVGSNN